MTVLCSSRCRVKSSKASVEFPQLGSIDDCAVPLQAHNSAWEWARGPTIRAVALAHSICFTPRARCDSFLFIVYTSSDYSRRCVGVLGTEAEKDKLGILRLWQLICVGSACHFCSKRECSCDSKLPYFSGVDPRAPHESGQSATMMLTCPQLLVPKG